MRRRPPRFTLSVLALLAALAGCELLSGKQATTDHSPRLPRLVAPKDSVQLEILFVDRPVTDSLLGAALWQELDQIAGMTAELRTRLRNEGWRIGHASSHPPRALQELLEMTSERLETMDPQRRLVGRRVALVAGTDAPIEVTDVLPLLQLHTGQQDSAEDYSNAQCVLRLRVEREQDGWVRLCFLPEIHHGEALLRPVATQFDWTRRRLPEIEPLYDQQFSLDLNLGELAVVTANQERPETVAGSFFRSLDKSGQLQRLLVVRVANMRRLTPVYGD